MATQITPFDFNSHPVRVVLDNGEPWFVANDVCEALGYSNPRDAIKKHCREKGVAKRDALTQGGQQAVTCLDEGNLYRLAIKSRKPEARKFEEWVCDEVLPAIRKTGRYEKPTGLLPNQQRHIQNIVSRLADNPGTTFASVYRSLKDKFDVGTYKDIPAERYPEACHFLGAQPLEGEYEPAQRGGDYHYPLESAKPRNMFLPHQTWMTDEALLDPEYNRPLQKLLNQLKADGNDVTGAMKEYQSLYLLVDSRRNMLNELGRVAEAGMMRGLRLDLA